jgi:hypothetical protein
MAEWSWRSCRGLQVSMPTNYGSHQVDGESLTTISAPTLQSASDDRRSRNPDLAQLRRASSRTLRRRGRQAPSAPKWPRELRRRERSLGMIAGLSPSHFGIVASSTFKCWETISGGECVSQSDKDTSDQFSIDGAPIRIMGDQSFRAIAARCAEPSDRRFSWRSFNGSPNAALTSARQ